VAAHPKIPKSEIDYIQNLQRGQTELQRALGRGQPALRDAAGNILALDPGSGTPLLVAQGHDVALSLAIAGAPYGTATITNEDGSELRDLISYRVYSEFDGNLFGSSVGVHFGDVGSEIAADNHLYGVHHGDMVDGALFGDSVGTHFGNSQDGHHIGDTFGVHHGPIDPPPKAFVIDHPRDPDRWLIHACTESPHNGVEYWGTATLDNGSALVYLPEYFEKLTHLQGRGVQVTPILPTWNSSEIKLSDLAVGATYPMDGQFTIRSAYGEDFEVSWHVYAVRRDIPELRVEPRRSEVRVSGVGPYRTYETK
jgi:hypothetical protein